METHQLNMKDIPEFEPDKLIQSALENTLGAINGYDAILWKIRSGYLAIIAGKDGFKDLATITSDPGLSFSIFFIIWGFSFAGFVVDFGYLRKKAQSDCRPRFADGNCSQQLFRIERLFVHAVADYR